MGLHNKHFYENITRSYVVAFGNLFNNIYIKRYNADGTENQREKVPMAYGPKEKYLYRNEQNKDLNERFAIKLPRISYELVEVGYDAPRKTPSANKLRNPTNNPADATWSFNALPYAFVFKVYVMGKTSDECLQIIEQIAPFFTPDHTLTLQNMPNLDQVLDVPVTMNSITLKDTWNGTFQERRDIVWELTFTLSGFLFPPTKSSKIILQSEWNINGYDNNGIPDPTIEYSSGIETEPLDE